MHEMSLAEGILLLVEETAAREGAQRVKAVYIEIGQLSAVEPEALSFCFDVVTRGSVAEGATLHRIDVPGAAWCLPCGTTVPVAQLYDACPRCGTYQLQVTQGDEMRIKELEVE